MLAVTSRYWSSESLIHHRGTRAQLPESATDGPSEVELALEIDGRDLAGALMVETNLLVGAATGPGAYIARRPGSVLWRATDRFAVEGSAGLLPVTRTSFRGMPLPKGAWYVSAGRGGWREPAMGQLLVILNEDNPGVVAALEGTCPKESADVVWQSLSVDIVHTIISIALEDPEFSPADSGTEELSKSALATGFIRTWYARAGEEIDAAIARLRYEVENDPSAARAVIQERLRYLEGERA